MRAALAVVLVFLVAGPVAAEVPIDLSWTSVTEYKPRDGSGVLIGGTVQGRDPHATWDRNTGTLRFTYGDQAFGGTFIQCCAEAEWNQGIVVPSDAAFLAATGQPGSALVTLKEAPTGITLRGAYGSMFDRVSFSGTGTIRSVAAPEPPVGLLVVGLGLLVAGAFVQRARS